MQPCPPSTSRDKDRNTGDIVREQKFRGEYHTCRSAQSSEGKSSRKREEFIEKRSNPDTITVNNFKVDLPSSAMRPMTGVISEVRKVITVPQTTRSTIRKQANSFVGCKIDCTMSRTASKVTQYCVLNKGSEH